MVHMQALPWSCGQVYGHGTASSAGALMWPVAVPVHLCGSAGAPPLMWQCQCTYVASALVIGHQAEPPLPCWPAPCIGVITPRSCACHVCVRFTALEDHTSTASRPPLKGFPEGQRIVFVDHNEPEEAEKKQVRVCVCLWTRCISLWATMSLRRHRRSGCICVSLWARCVHLDPVCTLWIMMSPERQRRIRRSCEWTRCLCLVDDNEPEEAKSDQV